MSLLLELDRCALAAVGAVLFDFEVAPALVAALVMQTHRQIAAIAIGSGTGAIIHISLSSWHSRDTLLIPGKECKSEKDRNKRHDLGRHRCAGQFFFGSETGRQDRENPCQSYDEKRLNIADNRNK